MCSAADDPTQYDVDVRPWPPIGKPTRIVVSGDRGLDALTDEDREWLDGAFRLAAPWGEMAATAGDDEPVQPSRWQRIRSAFGWHWS